MKLEADPAILDGIDRSLAALAIIMAFVISPALRWVDPIAFVHAGSLAALGFSFPFVTRHLAVRWRLLIASLAALTLAGAGYLAMPLILSAQRNAAANDRRCLAIERDMLSAQPRRSDGPALFQAFSCRPQSTGSVYAAPEGKR